MLGKIILNKEMLGLGSAAYLKELSQGLTDLHLCKKLSSVVNYVMSKSNLLY